MASERAMVAGFCGSISELPVFTAVEIGEHPVACAPKNFTGFSSTNPSLLSSSNAFLILVINDPPAIGTTTLSGILHPNCSAISKHSVILQVEILCSARSIAISGQPPSQPRRLNKRCESHRQPRLKPHRQRQQFRVAPHICGPLRNTLTAKCTLGNRRPDQIVVVGN